MEIIYKTDKVKNICEDSKKATNHFGGNKLLAVSLLARINAIKQAEEMKDIIAQRTMRFHKLINKGKRKNLEGYFAIDVKTPKDGWRIIIEPLDENKKPFVPCNIDEVSKMVRIIEIIEVSDHYE